MCLLQDSDLKKWSRWCNPVKNRVDTQIFNLVTDCIPCRQFPFSCRLNLVSFSISYIKYYNTTCDKLCLKIGGSLLIFLSKLLLATSLQLSDCRSAAYFPLHIEGAFHKSHEEVWYSISNSQIQMHLTCKPFWPFHPVELRMDGSLLLPSDWNAAIHQHKLQPGVGSADCSSSTKLYIRLITKPLKGLLM